MSSYPVYILGGGSRSGKDTVGEMMVQGRNGVMVAQADAMKRFMQRTFFFTVEQLWGPSDTRNAPDSRFSISNGGKIRFEEAETLIFAEGLGEQWLSELAIIASSSYMKDLRKWFVDLKERYLRLDAVLTPRAGLQTLGTEFGRSLYPSIWNDLAIKTAKGLLMGGSDYTREGGHVYSPKHPGYNFVVITDGRFRNELLGVKGLGGVAIKIENPAPDDGAVEKAGIAGHASEAELKGIPTNWYDYVLVNDKSKGLQFLKESVNQFMNGSQNTVWIGG